MSRYSVATIDNPEFINLQPVDINPLMSKCEIKVFYLGQNRNHSSIDEDTARNMAKTLRGAPIVGWYKKDKKDFADHGDRVVIDDEGVKFECMTKPYGFVSPDADVWFQNFEDTDEFGNKIVRKYLMTTGYLWTGQYEEAKLAYDEGRPESMELDDETVDGHWSTDLNTGIEFFIINDAIFSKLCILGEDVEPCFEGANVTKPEVSKTFTKVDDNFKNSLYTMMQELKFALQGGQKMPNTDGTGVMTEPAGTAVQDDTTAKNFTASQGKDDKSITDENQKSVEGEFAKADDEKDKKDDGQQDTNGGNADDTSDGGKDDSANKDDDKDSQDDEKDKEQKKKYALLEEKYTLLENEFKEMQTKYQALVEFKNNVEGEKKDALINSFYMLSDEDKQDVIENKTKYSLDEIEAKLSVICCRKKVSFAQNDDNDKKPATTFSLGSMASGDNTPDWVKACRETQNRQ